MNMIPQIPIGEKPYEFSSLEEETMNKILILENLAP